MAKKMPKKTIVKQHTNPFLKKFFPVLIFAAILGAALFIAAQLTARQAVAPNAPESEPAAASCGVSITKNKCGLAGGCSIGQKCKYVLQTKTARPYYRYSCVKDSSCPTPTPTPTKNPTTTPTPKPWTGCKTTDGYSFESGSGYWQCLGDCTATQGCMGGSNGRYCTCNNGKITCVCKIKKEG